MSNRFVNALTCVPLVLAALSIGCGKSSPVSVKGVVKSGGKPVPNCRIVFYPDVERFDPDIHGMGTAVTDENGEFEVKQADGTPGVPTGSYKVTFVAWVDSKGKPVPAEVKLSEVPGGAKNLVADKYESLSSTPERFTVRGDDQATFDLEAR